MAIKGLDHWLTTPPDEPDADTEDAEERVADQWQAERAAAAFDAQNVEVAEAGGICGDEACHHNQPTDLFGAEVVESIEASKISEEVNAALQVSVHEYTHPTFDMPLIIEASERSRAQAEEMLASDATDADKALLVCKEAWMGKGDFDNLPEWDG